jgi:CRP-like cAMP-binding protein
VAATWLDELERCPQRAVAAGLPVAVQADARLVVVEQGVAVLAAREEPARRRMILALLGRGRIAVPPRGREELRALTAVRIRLVDAETLAAVLARPAGAAQMLAALERTIRDREESIGQLGSIRHSERVRAKLEQLARDHGVSTERGLRLDLPLTHGLIGEMIGSARETVTVALRQLEHEGWLERNGRAYVIRSAVGAPLEPAAK